MPRPRFPQALAAGGEKKPGPWTDRVRAHAVAAAGAVSPLGERIVDVPELQMVDVRNPGEAAAGMIAGAVNIPVGQLPDRVGELDPRKPTVVYCAGGYRSSVAASFLRQRGFDDVSDVLGGYNAWDEATQSA